jgi:large subunit ribosomal protein L18
MRASTFIASRARLPLARAPNSQGQTRMNSLKMKNIRHRRRKARIRKTVFGTAVKPRLTVFRSLKHIYAQVIDDTRGRTLLSMSTKNQPIAQAVGKNGGNKTAAAKVGEAVARLALEKGISTVVFDRNGYRFHGRVKALADAARSGGLKF